MIQLSKNFSLNEFEASETADRLSLGNKLYETYLHDGGNGADTCTEKLQVIVNITALACMVLQPVRAEFGNIFISSGYRSPLLNRAIGGAKTSQHMKGEAADIKGGDMNKIFNFIRENLIFDQMIWEKGDDRSPAWVHVSYKAGGNRGEVLRFYADGTYKHI